MLFSVVTSDGTGMSKLVWMDLILVNVVGKIDGTYYRDMFLSQKNTACHVQDFIIVQQDNAPVTDWVDS